MNNKIMIYVKLFVLSLSVTVGLMMTAKAFAFDIGPVQLITFEQLPNNSYSALVKVYNYSDNDQVAIHGYANGSWSDFPCSYQEPIYGDTQELWRCENIRIYIDQFVIKYIPYNGWDLWDNNWWRDYYNNDGVLLGSGINVAVHDSVYRPWTVGGPISVRIDVRNIEPVKNVTVRWTINNWVSYTDSPAAYSFNWDSGQERWVADINMGAIDSDDFEYAVRYRLTNGEEHWDNNFSRNYRGVDCEEVFVGTCP